MCCRLIAILLGCLELSIDECIAYYEEISKTVFVKAGWPVDLKGNITEKYDHKKLEAAVKSVLKKEKCDQDMLLKKPHDVGCKVYVSP